MSLNKAMSAYTDIINWREYRLGIFQLDLALQDFLKLWV